MKKIFINGLYIFNIGLPSGIFLFLLISGKQSFAIQINLLFSSVLFFTSSLSSYHRQIVLSENNINYCKNIIINRVKFFPFILISTYILALYFLRINNLFLIFSVICLLFVIWLVEILLSIDEILEKKNFLLKYVFNFINGVCLLFFIFFVDEFYLSYYLAYFAMSYFYINIYDKRNIKKFNKPYNIKKNYLGYVSSLVVNFILLINKFFINHYFDPHTVSLVFLSFMITSFFNTIVANSFGPYLFSHFIKIKQLVLSAFLYLLFIASVLFYLIFFKNNLLILNIIIISGISGLILFVSFVIRQRLLSSRDLRLKVAISDIILSIISFFILFFIISFFMSNIFYFILVTTFLTFLFYFGLFILSNKILKN